MSIFRLVYVYLSRNTFLTNKLLFFDEGTDKQSAGPSSSYFITFFLRSSVSIFKKKKLFSIFWSFALHGKIQTIWTAH